MYRKLPIYLTKSWNGILFGDPPTPCNVHTGRNSIEKGRVEVKKWTKKEGRGRRRRLERGKGERAPLSLHSCLLPYHPLHLYLAAAVSAVGNINHTMDDDTCRPTRLINYHQHLHLEVRSSRAGGDHWPQTACSFGWWLMAGAVLFRKKSTIGWLLVAGLFWEKSNADWWLISQSNRARDAGASGTEQP
jgi:hypothetical protein